MKTLSLIFLMLLPLLGVHAQTNPGSVWTVSSLVNTESGETVQQSSEFSFSPANQQVTWTQHGGDKVYTFDISAVTGEWNDYQTLGMLTISVSRASLSGTLVFRRNVDGITITMNFPQDGRNVMPYIFHISTVNLL